MPFAPPQKILTFLLYIGFAVSHDSILCDCIMIIAPYLSPQIFSLSSLYPLVWLSLSLIISFVSLSISLQDARGVMPQPTTPYLFLPHSLPSLSPLSFSPLFLSLLFICFSPPLYVSVFSMHLCTLSLFLSFCLSLVIHLRCIFLCHEVVLRSFVTIIHSCLFCHCA